MRPIIWLFRLALTLAGIALLSSLAILDALQLVFAWTWTWAYLFIILLFLDYQDHLYGLQFPWTFGSIPVY